MLSEEANAATRREWRELGFFYERDDEQRCWRIVGSRDGLRRFSDEVAVFAGNSRNEPKSEHVHLGPYMYLEICSWPTSEITDHWIAGPLPALGALSESVRAWLPSAIAGETLSLREQFAKESPYDLILELREDEFDAAKEDTACW